MRKGISRMEKKRVMGNEYDKNILYAYTKML